MHQPDYVPDTLGNIVLPEYPLKRLLLILEYLVVAAIPTICRRGGFTYAEATLLLAQLISEGVVVQCSQVTCPDCLEVYPVYGLAVEKKRLANEGLVNRTPTTRTQSWTQDELRHAEKPKGYQKGML